MKYYILILLCAVTFCCKKKSSPAGDPAGTVTINLHKDSTIAIGQVACTLGSAKFNETLVLRLDSGAVQSFVLTYTGTNATNPNVSRTGIGSITQIDQVSSVGDIVLTPVPTCCWLLNTQAANATGYMIRHIEPGQTTYTYTAIYVTTYNYNSAGGISGVTLNMKNNL